MRASKLYNNILFSYENSIVLLERESVTVVNHMLSHNYDNMIRL